MQRRSQLIVGGLALLLALSIFALFESGGAPVATSKGIGEPPAAIEREPRASDAHATSVPPTADARVPSAPAGFRLRQRDAVAIGGRLVVLDELGREHADLDGTLVLLVSDLEGVQEVPIEFAKGAFRAIVPRGRALCCASIQAGDRAALPETLLDWTPFPEGGELLLRARFPGRSSLRVIASDTGAELEHVEVALAPAVHPDSFAGVEWHPGAQAVEVLVRDASSPVALPAPASFASTRPSERLFVRAPGYAWCEVVVRPARPAEHQVVLEPGGALVVHLTGHVPGEVLTLLRTDVPGGRVISIAMDLGASDDVVVESLPFGTYRVQVFTHRRDHHGSLALGHVLVRPGERARLDLAVAATVAHEPGVLLLLEGVVVVPPEWELASFALVLRGTTSDVERVLGPTDVLAVDGERDAWSFRFGELPFETYDLVVEPCGHAQAIEPWDVPVRVVVPPPAHVSLALGSLETGEVAPVELVGWRTGALRRGPRREVPRDPWSRRFEFRVPAGEVELSPMAGGRPQLPTLFPVRAGENELVLELAAEHVVSIELFCGGRRIEPSPLFAPHTLPVEGGQRRTGGAWIVVQGPGPYRVEFPPLPGFEPIEPREVDVPPGGVGRLAVELARAR